MIKLRLLKSGKYSIYPGRLNIRVLIWNRRGNQNKRRLGKDRSRGQNDGIADFENGGGGDSQINRCGQSLGAWKYERMHSPTQPPECI